MKLERENNDWACPTYISTDLKDKPEDVGLEIKKLLNAGYWIINLSIKESQFNVDFLSGIWSKCLLNACFCSGDLRKGSMLKFNKKSYRDCDNYFFYLDVKIPNMEEHELSGCSLFNHNQRVILLTSIKKFVTTQVYVPN